jgi:hypothetical protein
MNYPQVLEHTVEAGSTTSDAVRAESVLLTSLSHPHIIRVYRVATMRLQRVDDGSGSLPGGNSVTDPVPAAGETPSTGPPIAEVVQVAAAGVEEAVPQQEYSEDKAAQAVDGSGRGGSSGSKSQGLGSGRTVSSELATGQLKPGHYETWLILVCHLYVCSCVSVLCV